MWDALRLDVRHSFRSLRRAPALSLIVIVTVTLAVGATAAIGSLLNALVFRRLAVPNPGQLVALSAFDPRAGVDGYFYADTLKAYVAAQRSFSQLSLYSGAGLSRVETRSGVSEEAVTDAVSPDYFDMAGTRPSAGRFFNESDDAVAVISEQCRRRLFGTDSGLGEVIKVDTVPVTVIGVTAEAFSGLHVDGGFDIILPFAVVRAIAGRGPSTPLRSRNVVSSLGRFGRGLLVAQVALTMTLLVGAGLFTTTLAHLRANDTSLQSQRIVFARAYREPGDQQLLPRGYYQALVNGLARVPGADAAALSVYYPTYFGLKAPVPQDYHYLRADGATPIDGTVMTDYVSPGFFDLFRLQLLKGRDVSWDDGLEKPGVAVISASLARALFPASNAVGQRIRIDGPDRRDVEVIGVAADAPYFTLSDPRPLVVFRPITQEVERAQFPMAYVRATGDLATVRDGYTRVIRSLGHRALRGFSTSPEWVDGALVRERFTAGLSTFAAALTVLLACIGVYGLLAYSVAARTREIGLRLALGAKRQAVVWMIVRDGLAIAVPGVLIGAPCAWAAARLVRAQLYGIAPGDSRTLLIGAATLLTTVLIASLIPARRASRIAPLDALREE